MITEEEIVRATYTTDIKFVNRLVKQTVDDANNTTTYIWYADQYHRDGTEIFTNKKMGKWKTYGGAKRAMKMFNFYMKW
jgi:hypothetical protein